MYHHYDRVLQERIGLTEEEEKLIKLNRFRRLKKIKQNGFAYIKYPDAINNRYDHSIGTLYWSTRLYNSIFSDESLNIEDNIELKALRMAALLHDFGHGPFSHVLEEMLIRNDKWFNKNPWRRISNKYKINKPHELITNTFLDLKTVANIINPDVLKIVKEILRNQHHLSLIISGDLDADRIDYLLRDSHYSGLPFGFNIKVIFNEILEQHLQIKQRNSTFFLNINPEAVPAYEQFLVARYAHYKYIAYDPQILSTNLNFIQIFEEALERLFENEEIIAKILYFMYTNLTDLELLRSEYSIPNVNIRNELLQLKNDIELQHSLKNFELERNTKKVHFIKITNFRKQTAYNLLKSDKFDIRSAEKIFSRDLAQKIRIMPCLSSTLSMKTCVDDPDINREYNPAFLYDYSPIVRGLEQKMFFDCGTLIIHDKKISKTALIEEFNSLIRTKNENDLYTYALISFLEEYEKNFRTSDMPWPVRRTPIFRFLLGISDYLSEIGVIVKPITASMPYYSIKIYKIMQKLEFLDVISEDYNIKHDEGYIPSYVYSIGEYAKEIKKILPLTDAERDVIDKYVDSYVPKRRI